MITTIDQEHFRNVLGQYPTGVAVVTSSDPAGEPLGMTVGSFSSVSLDPPLVAFIPDKSSQSWRALREAGDKFCVNILGAHQEEVCRGVAVRKASKFDDIPWRHSKAGNPIIEGSVAYIDCSIEVIHEAGDHHIVIGRVESLDIENTTYPLLFFRGGYGSFIPASLAAGDVDMLDQLALVDAARPIMDELAHYFDSEVTVTIRIYDELVLAAAAGRMRQVLVPRQVGHRRPFKPPMGSVNAAWGDEALRARWLDNLGSEVSEEQKVEYAKVPDRVKARGVAMSYGLLNAYDHEDMGTADLEDDGGYPKELSGRYNPAATENDDLRSVSVPAFDVEGGVAFTMTLWIPPDSQRELDDRVIIGKLQDAGMRATAAIGGIAP